jgi:hypothetical protein
MIDPGSRGPFQSNQGIHIIIADEGRLTTMHAAHLIGLTFKRFHVLTFKRPLIPTVLTFQPSILPYFHPSTPFLTRMQGNSPNWGLRIRGGNLYD